MLPPLLIVALLLTLSLGFTAFAVAPDRAENRAFAAFQWLAALWVVNDLAFWCLSPGAVDGTAWARTALLLALALQLAFLRFSWAFPPGPVPAGPATAAVLVAVGAAGLVLSGRAPGEVAWRGGTFVVEVTASTFVVGAAIYALFLGAVATIARRRAGATPEMHRLLSRLVVAAVVSAVTSSALGVLLPLLGITTLLPAAGLGILLGAVVHFHSLLRGGFLRPPGQVDPRRGLPVTGKLAVAVALGALLGACAALLAARLSVGPGPPATWARAAVLGLVGAALPALALIVVARRVVSGPLAEVTAVALRVADGQTSVRAPVPAGGDELALLAGAMNSMMTRLEHDRAQERELALGLGRTERLAIAGSLAAGVAHEVNNPLAAVSSLVQLAAERADAGTRPLLVDALGQIDRVTSVLRELLDVARPAERARERVVLADVAERTARLLRFDRRFRVVVLELACDPAAVVLGDPDQLTQVLLNLLLNAADALAGRERGRVRLAVVRRGEQVVLTVSDDGPGVPDAVKARLFQPFVTTKPQGAGTGLGLSVCRDLVRDHEGEIELESRPGVGTTVTVRLPAAHAEAAA